MVSENELFYFILTDHINGVIERIKEGYIIKNTLLYEIKSFYPSEYEVGKFAIDVVYQYTKVKLEEDEAGFIAFYFISNSLNDKLSMTPKVLKIIKEILVIIKYYFIIALDENNFYYQRFLNHLKFFAIRILLRKPIQKFELTEMQEVIFKTYPKVKGCLIKISNFIQKVYQYNISENEKLYISIHLTTLLKVMEKNLKFSIKILLS